jgi:hypothetical protein
MVRKYGRGDKEINKKFNILNDRHSNTTSEKKGKFKMINVEIKKAFYEVKELEQKLRELRGVLEQKEENLTRTLVEQKAWALLKPIYSRIAFELNH